jgi:hypothetical protein
MMRRVELMSTSAAQTPIWPKHLFPRSSAAPSDVARGTPNAHIQITLSAREGSRRQTVNMLSSEERHECDAH